MDYTFESKQSDPYDVHVMRSLSKPIRDMEDYIIMKTKDMQIESVMDVGSGMKGAVGAHYSERIKKIKQGYLVDISLLKDMEKWKPLKIKALDLLDHVEPKSVDIVQAFGFMAHLLKEDGYKFIEIAEKIARKFVIFSAATCICARYNSSWQWPEFEALGYTSNWHDTKVLRAFKTEAIAWKHLT